MFTYDVQTVLLLQTLKLSLFHHSPKTMSMMHWCSLFHSSTMHFC